MRITILTLGSRGDVQPYVALGLGLQRVGHEVTILAGDEFEAWVSGYGLRFHPFGFSVRESVSESESARDILEGRRGLLRGAWEMLQHAKALFDLYLASAWEACKDADAVICSTLGMAAYHVAEKQGMPCLWALTMPAFQRTRAVPSPIVPLLPWRSGMLNLLTHRLAEGFWHLLTAQFYNPWRQKQLGLPPLSLWKWPYAVLNGQPVPMLFHFSPAVIPRPPDWARPGSGRPDYGQDHLHITGYWFLDHDPAWQPPADLIAFLEAGPPPVYAGFGSMVARRAEATARIVLQALRRAGQRGVLAVGWSGVKDSTIPELHEAIGRGEVFLLEECPHDWLFPRMAAVVHHGGAGTTGAGLRAGIPSILVPFAGDQLFWGERVAALGVGPEPIPRRALTADKLAYAIRLAVEHGPMRARAAALGERIRAEDGVGQAVRIINGVLADG